MALRLADSCERFVREVEEVSAEAGGLRIPITVGAGEVVIREFLIPKIGRQSKGKQPVSWVMLEKEQVTRAKNAGAVFGLAPGLNPEIIAVAQQCGLQFSPGVMTPSEAEQALSLGCKLLKFFPAERQRVA